MNQPSRLLILSLLLCVPTLSRASDWSEKQTLRLELLFENTVPERLLRCVAGAKPGTVSVRIHPEYGSLEVMATCTENGEDVVGETLVQPEDAARVRFDFEDIDGKKVVVDLDHPAARSASPEQRRAAIVGPEQLIKGLSRAAGVDR